MKRSQSSGGSTCCWYGGMAGVKPKGKTKVKNVLSAIGIAALVVTTVFCIKKLNNEILMPDQAPKTYENLISAVSGEVTARQKYLDFAEKAAQEGYKNAERLFSAMADAEEIHLQKHFSLISGMKYMEMPQAKKIEVLTTRENILNSIENELVVNEERYTEYIECAEEENYGRALKLFRNAQGAERTHAVLLQELLSAMEDGEADKEEVYYLCSLCGAVAKNSRPFLCDVCGSLRTSREEYS